MHDVLVQVVVQRILVALEDCELDALVGPQAIEGREKLVGHGLFGADVGGSVDHFRVALGTLLAVGQRGWGGWVSEWGGGEAHNVVFVLKVGVVFLHGLEDGLEGGDEVVENGGSPCLALKALEPAGIDDAHLLENRRLATLAGTWGMCVSQGGLVIYSSGH